MNSKLLLDWVLMIALVILSKINKWRVSFVEQDTIEPLTFLREPHDYLGDKAKFGDKITFECRTLDDDTQISWYHDGVRVNPGRDVLPNSLVTVDVNNRLSRLVIHHLIPKLSGRYHCKAYNDKVAVRKGAWVNMTIPANCAIGLTNLTKLTKKSGDSWYQLANEPRPYKNITWTQSFSENPYKLAYFRPPIKSGSDKKNHTRIQPDGSLNISSLSILDEGMWTRVVDEKGCIKQTKYKLEIEYSEAEVCGHFDSYTKEVDDENVNTDAGVVGQVVGGKDAEIGSAPWYAGLCMKGRDKVHCGGTLIGRKWVVTAAHCVYKSEGSIALKDDELTVKLGSHTPECDLDQDYRVVRIIKHPGENIPSGEYYKDIAVLELALDDPKTNTTYSTIKPLVRPACLDRSEFYGEEGVYTPGKIGRLVGLGKLGEREVDGAKTLQTLDIPMVARNVCRNAARPHDFDVNMICVGVPEGGKDSCKGDSGGPYTMQIQGRTFLVGVVSWGIGCARPGKYGYYIKAGDFHDWINGEMKVIDEAPTDDDGYDYGYNG